MTAATVGTHSGTFHCDEALGCYLLRLTGRFKDAKIVRTRAPEALQSLDAVLDVGGVYQPGNGHHRLMCAFSAGVWTNSYL